MVVHTASQVEHDPSSQNAHLVGVQKGEGVAQQVHGEQQTDEDQEQVAVEGLRQGLADELGRQPWRGESQRGQAHHRHGGDGKP